VIDIQQAIGSDIAMVLDECVPYPSPYDYVKASIALTTRWARRCLEAKREFFIPGCDLLGKAD